MKVGRVGADVAANMLCIQWNMETMKSRTLEIMYRYIWYFHQLLTASHEWSVVDQTVGWVSFNLN